MIPLPSLAGWLAAGKHAGTQGKQTYVCINVMHVTRLYRIANLVNKICSTVLLLLTRFARVKIFIV
jgi:hypothetical protein